MLRAAVAAVLVCVGGGVAAAEPVTRLSAGVGGRQYLGELGELYALGYVIMARAAWQPGPFGLGWSASWGSFESEFSGNPEETLYTLELGADVRTRIDLGGEEVRRAILVMAGVQLARASTPVPPEDDRGYWGPAMGATFELIIADEVILGIGLDYGVIATGPESVTLAVTVGVGSGNPDPSQPADE